MGGHGNLIILGPICFQMIVGTLKIMDWLVRTIIVQIYPTLISIYTRGNFVNHNWEFYINLSSNVLSLKNPDGNKWLGRYLTSRFYIIWVCSSLCLFTIKLIYIRYDNFIPWSGFRLLFRLKTFSALLSFFISILMKKIFYLKISKIDKKHDISVKHFKSNSMWKNWKVYLILTRGFIFV